MGRPLKDTFVNVALGMETFCFRPSKKGTFLTSLQGCIYGVSETKGFHSIVPTINQQATTSQY